MALRTRTSPAALLFVAVSTLGVATSLFDYFMPENGIDGSLGALLVIVSTALMLLAAAAISFGFAGGWARNTLHVLIALDILATAFAAYMLEARVLLVLMTLAFLAWLYAVFAGVRPPAPVSARAAS